MSILPATSRNSAALRASILFVAIMQVAVACITQGAHAGGAATPPITEFPTEVSPAPAPQSPNTPADVPAGPNGNLTVVPRSSPPTPTAAPAGPLTATPVQFVALLTENGQRIDQGLVWRVFHDKPAQEEKDKIVSLNRDASPTIKLKPGDYLVNASFGRANLTRRISVGAPTDAPAIEEFVLNAGGLRLTAMVSGKPAPQKSVSYAIFTERDQANNRELVMTGARPGYIIRLNAGIYHLVSTCGDANAEVASDVTVEAGKLTEATIAHAAAKVTLRLVARAGGEALADTQWTIQTPEGQSVKTSVGALPSHMLAPGVYAAVAKSAGKTFRKEFAVRDGESTEVEVVME